MGTLINETLPVSIRHIDKETSFLIVFKIILKTTFSSVSVIFLKITIKTDFYGVEKLGFSATGDFSSHLFV